MRGVFVWCLGHHNVNRRLSRQGRGFLCRPNLEVRGQEKGVSRLDCAGRVTRTPTCLSRSFCHRTQWPRILDIVVQGVKKFS